MKDLISVVIPNYNRSELLQKAILSVVNQKSELSFDRELIIVDDGSTDDSKEVINSYVKEYPKNIRAIFQNNQWVNKARNVWIDNISPNSTYFIELDNDDEISSDFFDVNLKKRQELKTRWIYDEVVFLISFCEDEGATLIWSKDILKGKKEIKFWYKDYLKQYFSVWEMISMDRSYIYLDNKDFRFDEKQLIWESILWSSIYKKYYEQGKYALIYDYIWRIFRLNHGIRTSRNISKKRFENSAVTNEKILEIIWLDLKKYWLMSVYNEFLFRIWVNYVLWWKKDKWLLYLSKSRFIKAKVVYLLALISPKLILWLFKIYTKND